MLDERLQPGGQRGGHHVEPVGGRGVRPFLDGVGDLLGGAGEGSVPAAAAEPADELPDGELVAPGQLDDQLVAALRAADVLAGVYRGRKRAVHL